MSLFHDHEEHRILRDILHVLERIERKLYRIDGFVIVQEASTPMVLIAPGNSPVFTATPNPAGAVPAVGNLPKWTSSDEVNAPVTADETGLVGTVAIPETATVGGSFTLTVTYLNADGTVAEGAATFTIVAVPPPPPPPVTDITSFTIEQTA